MKLHVTSLIYPPNKWATSFILGLILSAGCAKDKEILVPVNIAGMKIKLHSTYKDISNYIAKNKIDLMADDSNNLRELGINTYYFGKKNPGAKYYIELYFIANKLNGLKILVYSDKISDDAFNNELKKNKVYFNDISKTNPEIYLDTLKLNSKHEKFMFFIKTHRLQEKLM